MLLAEAGLAGRKTGLEALHRFELLVDLAAHRVGIESPFDDVDAVTRVDALIDGESNDCMTEVAQ